MQNHFNETSAGDDKALSMCIDCPWPVCNFAKNSAARGKEKALLMVSFAAGSWTPSFMTAQCLITCRRKTRTAACSLWATGTLWQAMDSLSAATPNTSICSTGDCLTSEKTVFKLLSNLFLWSFLVNIDIKKFLMAIFEVSSEIQCKRLFNDFQVT